MNGTAEDVREAAERLRLERRPFVTATVVRAERPTSARPGDTALVHDDGTVLGFVGGDCAHTNVQVQALAALEAREPVLLRISPEAVDADAQAHPAESGTVTVHNPCLSGGALEIFLEPWAPPSLVVVHGDAPIAKAIRELARWLGFDARPWDDGAGVPPDADAVVIASHGGGSERAVVEAALRAGVPYVGLVASPRRGAAVLAALGLAAADRARVRTPAGIDIGARTPEEVALTVLAEIVSVRPRAERPPRAPNEAAPNSPAATDPVCGMSVAAVESSLHVDHGGTRYWFCGPGCLDAFRADPAAFGAR